MHGRPCSRSGRSNCGAIYSARFHFAQRRNLQEQIARIDIAVIVRQQIARHRGHLPGDSSHLCWSS
jgi:hypothetical protein